jgi:hypothetical protein
MRSVEAKGMKLYYEYSRRASRKDCERWGIGSEDKQAQRLLNTYLLHYIKTGLTVYDESKLRLSDCFVAQHILHAPPLCQKEILHAAVHCLEWGAANQRFIPGLCPLLNHLLSGHMEADIAPRFWSVFASTRLAINSRWGLDLAMLLTMAEAELAQKGQLTPPLRTFLGRFRQYEVDFRTLYSDADILPFFQKTQALLEQYETPIPGSGEAWGEAAMDDFDTMEPGQQSAWTNLFRHMATATQSKPTPAWLRTAGKLMDAVGKQTFREHAARWLMALPSSPFYVLQTDLIPTTRGLLWCCGLESDRELAQGAGNAAVCYFARLPDVGPRNTVVGNAAVYALGQMNHPEAIAQLTQLRRDVKYNQVQTQINRALATAAKAAQVSSEELEEIGVPTGGVDAQGRLHQELDGYQISVHITGGEEPVWTFTNPDGTSIPELPQAVMQEQEAEWKAFQQKVAKAADLLAVQRDRLEALLMSSREWDWQTWNERYAQHPLLADMVGRLIWQFDSDTTTTQGSRHNGLWVDSQGAPVPFLQNRQAAVRVRLWHPVHPHLTEPAVVLQWRRFLDAQQIVQPFPQAHREIYLLTEAEKQTGTYSTRFAAQLLRHYRFDKQMAQRRWKYDSSVNELRVLRLLPDHALRVEWNLERTNDEGLLLEPVAISLLTSGSVQFRNAQGIMNLTDVPPRIYSEIMREIGLLTSGCGVGENPLWNMAGSASQEADDPVRSRHQILTILLPRLNVAERLSLEANALVVRGDWHTYYIDLKTSAVAMGADRRYVCIQPQHNPLSQDERGSALLPYEGDPTLIVILSKAFLLCQDSATMDKVILAQIHPEAATRQQQAR